MEIEVANFVNLTGDRLRTVLEWRNQESVRAFSNDKKLIALNEHIAFVEALKRDATKAYYIALLKTANAEGGGVFHFNDITATQAKIGLYKNEKSTLKGAGGVLMELTLLIARQKRLKTLRLDILKHNDRAMRLYVKYDFKIVAENDKSYYMQRAI